MLFVLKLNKHNSEEVNKAIKSIFKNKLYKENIKGIITDQGKEFSKWKEIEKITGINVYFCDAGTPTQKPKVERMNREIREYLTKATDFNQISQKEINKLIKLWKLLMKSPDPVWADYPPKRHF